jgi:Plasmid pRiA4b ORF-3-like protein
MKRRRKQPEADESASRSLADLETILQFKVWLIGISPMVWRRVLVPAAFTLGELHGVIQVAMGWEGIHLYQFSLRAVRYGSWELSASSPDVTLAALRLRKGARSSTNTI